MPNPTRRFIHKSFFLWPLVAALAVLWSSASVLAQIPTATITGTVQDSTGAVIPGAAVELKNANSGDTRSVLSNDSGLFAFPGLPNGEYNLTVSAQGFARYVLKNYHVDPGDTRAISNIVLAPSSVHETTVVTADAERIDTTSGETSSLITASDIEHLSVEGRDVTELFKILPGFAIANQGISNTAYDPGQVSCCPGGAIGSYSADGTPIAGTAMKWDGADLTDPGAYSGTLQNVNYDMVSEVKVQIGSFTAEESNGPVVINAVTKAGGQQYHGALYTYARTSQLNSTDWLAGALGYGKPPDRYIYPGLFVGGPVRIPGTRFRDGKRATFFLGFEDYAQRQNYAYGSASQAIVHALVPTDNMKKGDFSAPELASYLGPGNSNLYDMSSAPTIDKYGNPVSNGNIAHTLDPGAQILFSRLPSPNVPSNGIYNYITQNLIANDMWQMVLRSDVAISDKYKLFVRYSSEQGLTGVPQTPYYSPSAVMGGVNTPGGGLVSSTDSQSATASLTMIVSPTATNVASASLTYLNFQFKPKNISALNASTYSYPYQGIYQNNGSKELPQFQDYWYNGMPLLLVDDFSYGPLYTKKLLPAVDDIFTKLLGRHELKAGVYIEQVTNNQRQINAPNPTNGALASYYYTPSNCGWMPAPCPITDLDGTNYYNSGNYLANEMQGLFGSWTQQNFAPSTDLFFWNVDWYATDSWKIRKSLAINFGVRFEHLGTWDDRHGTGMAIFDPSTLKQTASDKLPLPGFLWHSIDSSIPTSGVSSRWAFVEPRLGFSWDTNGKGTTVVRAGYGQYRYHDSWNDVSQAQQSSQGVRSVSSISGSGGLSLEGISKEQITTNTGALTLNAYGLDPSDHNQALTQTYTLAIDRALPYKMQLEVAYIGNHTTHLFNTGSQTGATLSNANVLPYGALFAPVKGVVPTPYQIGLMDTNTVNSYRKYGTNPYDPQTGQLITSPYGSVNNYGTMSVPQHVAYSNYNGIQFALQRQADRLRYGVNYTFGKSLGILGSEDGGGNPIDATNLRANYGITPFDRTHVFNANYSYTTGKVLASKLAGGLVNAWEISGITGVQSGQNLQVATGTPNFGASLYVSSPQYTGGGTTSAGTTNGALLGTTDITEMPILKCDPRSGRAHGQYVNGNCFAFGAQTAKGPIVNGPDFYPYVRGPLYFSSDLSLQKSFHVGESRQLQFRYSAFNFLNHALPSFNSARANEYTLTYVGDTPGDAVPEPTAGSPAQGSQFGVPTLKQGRRVSEVSLKYVF